MEEGNFSFFERTSESVSVTFLIESGERRILCGCNGSARNNWSSKFCGSIVTKSSDDASSVDDGVGGKLTETWAGDAEEEDDDEGVDEAEEEEEDNEGVEVVKGMEL